jgi:arylsulfatase A-like enzyme
MQLKKFIQKNLFGVLEGLDGVDQTEMLTGQSGSSRHEMVYNIQATDDKIGTSGAIRFGNWKLMVNQGLLHKYLLFDLENDKEETTNLVDEFPEVFAQMLERYEVIKDTFSK